MVKFIILGVLTDLKPSEALTSNEPGTNTSNTGKYLTRSEDWLAT